MKAQGGVSTTVSRPGRARTQRHDAPDEAAAWSGVHQSSSRELGSAPFSRIFDTMRRLPSTHALDKGKVVARYALHRHRGPSACSLIAIRAAFGRPEAPPTQALLPPAATARPPSPSPVQRRHAVAVPVVDVGAVVQEPLHAALVVLGNAVHELLARGKGDGARRGGGALGRQVLARELVARGVVVHGERHRLEAVRREKGGGGERERERERAAAKGAVG